MSNALLGGAVGGALTGDRAGQNRRHRNEIELQAELALIANGLLRHEVLNATAIIDGYASLFEEDSPEASDVAAIKAATERIESTVTDVGEVGRARDDDSLRAIELDPILEEELTALGERYREATFTRSVPARNVQVLADHRLRLLIRKVLGLVVERDPEATVTVGVTTAQYEVSLLVSVADDPSTERGTAENGDPAVDFDHRIVGLLTDYYGGEFEGTFPEPTADRSASALLRLPRATGERNAGGQIGVASAGIGAAILGGLAAGAVMGLLSEALAGLLPIIGSLYGVANPVIGWVTHLFHSVIFALLFAAGYAHLRGGTTEGTAVTRSLLGAGWGVILWLVAAGVIMPVWLRLVGVPTAVPNLTAIGFFTHVVWGTVLGALYRPLRRQLETSERWDRLQAAIGLRVGRVFG